MATTLSTTDLGPLTTVRRTWRTTIESAVGAPVTITAHREELLRTEDLTIVKRDQNAGVITRALGAVAGETVTLGDGTELTAVQVALAVEAFLEKWDAEDLAPAPVEEPAEDPEAEPAP